MEFCLISSQFNDLNREAIFKEMLTKVLGRKSQRKELTAKIAFLEQVSRRLKGLPPELLSLKIELVRQAK